MQKHQAETDIQWSLITRGSYVLKITRNRRNPQSSQLIIIDVLRL